MQNNLKERLKYWNFRCMNCDNKIHQSLKSLNERINKEFICSDCGEKIHIYLNLTIRLDTAVKSFQLLTSNTIMCRCNITGISK